jgi:aquaporin related protein
VEERRERRKHEKKPWGKAKAVKNHIVAATGEFIGTVMFLFFAFAAHIMIISQSAEVPLATGNEGASAQNVVFISLAYGMSLLVTAWGWYRISGGLFNPAVRPPLLNCASQYLPPCLAR